MGKISTVEPKEQRPVADVFSDVAARLEENEVTLDAVVIRALGLEMQLGQLARLLGVKLES